VTIGAATAGRPTGDVSTDINARLKAEVPVPPGYSVEFGGDTKVQNESFGQIFQALGLSVLLMYMLMVALFESLLYPLVVMLSLPLALVGAIGGLAVTGKTLNIVSMIGMIMLTGLVGKNAILLVDFTNTLRARGLARNAALLEAGPTRLRPIVMTTVAMILAMFPLAAGLNEGSEWRSPMAVVIMGGLLTSSLLTLLFVPAVYTLFDDLQRLVGRLFGRKPPEQPSGPAQPLPAERRPREERDGDGADGRVPERERERVPVGAGYGFGRLFGAPPRPAGGPAAD